MPGPRLVNPPAPVIVPTISECSVDGSGGDLVDGGHERVVKGYSALSVLLPVPTAAGTSMVAGPAPAASKTQCWRNRRPKGPKRFVKPLAASLWKVDEPTVTGSSSEMIRFSL